ncbi:MAG: MarP family serine protease [Solirubrobacterales bacterium]|nr:MarP family serine protease [Solirubrobacterales bacterium]
MSAVDWVILAITILLAARGFHRGFLVGALSLGGFALGAVIGTHLAPQLLSQRSHSPYAPLFSLGGALLLGGLLGAAAEALGARFRRLLFIPGLKFLDGLGGALLGACLGLGAAWVAGALLLGVTGASGLRHQLAESQILRGLDEFLPPTGGLLDSLSRIDPLPSVNGPAANVQAPSAGIVGAAAVQRAGHQSVVRIQGVACGLGIEGSGWVAGPGLVVTNAHVVAGERQTTVQDGGGGPTLDARVVRFDPHEDIAVLSVPSLKAPALSLAPNPGIGSSAAIVGYPQDGPLSFEPGRLGQTRPTSTQDAYGNGPVIRDIAALRGTVRPGNSGGPMIDSAGQVIATVFAEITNAAKGQPGGFAVPNSVVSSELAKAGARRPVSTQSCAD